MFISGNKRIINLVHCYKLRLIKTLKHLDMIWSGELQVANGRDIEI